MAQIEIFTYSLNADDLEWLTPLAESFMSRDELARWQRFRVPEPAQVFLVSRYLIRHLLSQRLSCALTAIEFVVGEHGKPALRVPESTWQFNLSHSRDSLVLAMAEGIELGVDIEATITRKALEDLAEQVLTPREMACFVALNEAERQSFLTRAWVLKESYVKLMGKGVWHGLRALEVDVDGPAFLGGNLAGAGDGAVRAMYLEAPLPRVAGGEFQVALAFSGAAAGIVQRQLHSLKKL